MVSNKERDLGNGDIFAGIVSHVIDSHTFYVATLEELEKLNAATNKLKENMLQKIFWIPGVGEYFLVNIQNDGLMRATRSANKSEDAFCLYLLDTGEEFPCSIKDLHDDIFIMPDYLTEIPPIAFQCTWNSNSDERDDEKICLEDSLYRKFTFEVIKTQNNCSIQVKMWTYDDGEISDELNLEEEESESLNMLQLREILEKEDPVIFDAQVAVQGFHTKDDDRRCKFYDSRTGGCWKGGRCKEKHIPEIVDGTCRDIKHIHIFDDNFSPPRPKRKTFYSIKIISFIDLNRFTCHYYNADEFYSGKNLQNLREQINSGTYKLLKELPAIDEMVTVKIEDNFYRARVLDKTDVNWTLPVFLVDEGTYIPDVPYKNIYQYCVNLRDYPFFAVEMEITDIKSREKNPRDNEAQKWMFATQQNSGPLKVLIVDNFPDIRCKLYDLNYCEVGKVLIEKGLVELKEIPPPSDVQPNYFIPG